MTVVALIAILGLNPRKRLRRMMTRPPYGVPERTHG
jgi:hypothetical protein